MYLTPIKSFNMAFDIKQLTQFNMTMRAYTGLENVHVIAVL